MNLEKARSVQVLAQAVATLANVSHTDPTIEGILDQINLLVGLPQKQEEDNAKPVDAADAVKEAVCDCPPCLLARTVTHGEGDVAVLLDAIVAEYDTDSVRRIILAANESIHEFTQENKVDAEFAARMFKFTTVVVTKVEPANKAAFVSPMQELIDALNSVSKR